MITNANKQMLDAFELGQKLGIEYDHNIMPMYRTEDIAQEIIFDDVLLAFFEAGFHGSEMPSFVEAYRYGDIPASGKSYNYRDNVPEAGVSVVEVIGGAATQDKVSLAFVADGRPKVKIAGWLVTTAKGSDGEPLLVGAVRV